MNSVSDESSGVALNGLPFAKIMAFDIKILKNRVTNDHRDSVAISI